MASTNEAAAASPRGIASPRMTEHSWKAGEIVDSTTSSTVALPSQQDADSIKQSLGLTSVPTIGEAKNETEQSSSPALDTNSKRPNEVVATTTATTVGNASITESVSSTDTASDAGVQTEEPQCNEPEVNDEIQKPHDRDDLTCIKAGSEARQRASAKSRRTQDRENQANDDLTRIQGIGPATAKLLQRSGISSYRELYEANPERLQSILKNGGAKFEKVDSSSWSDQTRFAINGDWIGLSSWTTAHVAASEKTSVAAGHSEATVNQNSVEVKEATAVRVTPSKVDDLTKIHGIGPATAKLLRKSGITTFGALREAGTGHLQTILKKGGTKFKLVDPSSWIEQSRFAMNDDWIGLSKWTTAHGVSTEEASPVTAHSQLTTNGKLATAATAASTSPSKSDDLTKIHGVGPATAQLLQEFGITSFRTLHETSPKRLKSILKIGGSNFELVDSSSWGEQTRFAVNGDWDGLSKWMSTHVAETNETPVAARNLQATSDKNLVAGSTPSTSARSGKGDDLTKIHGLGPASRKKLNSKGINSFAQVASMTSQQLATLFAESAKRFQLIDTSTWPAQAQQFASAQIEQEATVINLETEILNEIDSIRDIASSAQTSSSAPRKKEQASTRD